MRIRSASPSVTNEEVKLVSHATKIGWRDKRDYYTNKFNKEFKKLTKIKYCLPVSHCTDAIHLAMIAIGIKPGDEVIVPDVTWVASATPITYLGGKPVFADIDKESLCIDHTKVEKLITKKTKAIVGVNLFGNCPNWKLLRAICRKYSLYLIEDAAGSLGTKYNNKHTGNFGDISVFSFNVTKIAMGGQGGVFCTNNKKFYDIANLYAGHGIDEKKTGKYYWSTVIGYNYRWTNIQAALAYGQIKRLKNFLKYKKQIYKKYLKLIHEDEKVRFVKPEKDTIWNYWLVGLIINSKKPKEKLIKLFEKYKIDLRPMLYPLSSMPPFKKYLRKNIRKQNQSSYFISRSSVCLPNGYDLNETKIRYFARLFNKLRKSF